MTKRKGTTHAAILPAGRVNPETLRALLAHWRAAAEQLYNQPGPTMEAGRILTLNACADALEALLEKGPV